MILDDRRAGHALLALAGAAVVAFVALFLARVPERGPPPAPPAVSPTASSASPGGKPVPPAPPAPSLPAAGLAKRMRFVLRGTVLGHGGRTPVPGAVVEIVPRAGRHERVVADGKGEFTWTSEEPTPAAVVWALAPGSGLGHVFVQGAPGREIRQDVVLVAPGPRTVEVKTAEGAVAEGAEVSVFVSGEDAPSDSDRVAGARVGADGLCSPLVPSGIPLRFSARSADGTSAGEVVVAGAPGPPATVEIVLRPKERAGR